MEKHIVTSLFLVLIFVLLVRRTWVKEELSLLGVSIAYPATMYVNDPYLVWSLFLGASIGILLIAFLKKEVLTNIDTLIVKKLQWKIPLLFALGINAVGRFWGAEWCWFVITIFALVLIVKGMRTVLTYGLIIISSSLYAASVLEAGNIILSLLIIATIYIVQAVLREISL